MAGPEKIRLTSQQANELRDCLDEIKSLHMPGNKIIWHEDGWNRMKDAKLDERWDDMRKGILKFSNIDSVSIENKSSNNLNSIFNNIFKKDKFSDVEFKNNDVLELAQKFNPVFDLFKKEYQKDLIDVNNESKELDLKNKVLENYLTKDIISFDGKIIYIDIEQSAYLLKSSAKLILENKDLIFTLNNAGALLGLGLLYKSVANTFKLTTTDLEKTLKDKGINKDSNLVDNIIKGQKVFNNTGAIWVTISLFVITNLLLNNKPLAMRVGLETSSDNVSQKFLPTMLLNNKIINKINNGFKNKLFNCIKVIIIFIMLLVYSFWNKFIIAKFMIIKIVGLIFLSLFALLYLSYVLILIKNFNIKINEDEIKLPWYYPNKLKKHIKHLMLIDDKELSLIYMELYLKKGLFLFILTAFILVDIINVKLI